MAKNIRRKSSNRKKSIIIMIVSIVAVVALGVVLGIIAKINIDRQNANKNPGNSNPSTPSTPTTPGGSDTPGSGDDTPGTGGETPETPVDPDIPVVPDGPGTGGGETPDEPGTGGNEDPDDPGTGGEDPDEPEIPDTPVVPVKALTVDITDAGLTNNFTSNGSSAVATITNNSAEVDGEILSLTNTLDLAKMKAGDAVSFEYEVENKMDNEYNYRLSILASGDNDLISKLIVELEDAEAEQILYGATNMVAQLGNVSVGQTKTLKVTVKVKTGETVSVDDVAKLQFVLNGVQVATGTNASDDVYNVGYKEVATKAELATALTNVGTTGELAADVNILITNEAIADDNAHTIELDKDLNVNGSLSIMAPIGTTITITMDEGTAIKVGKGEALTLTNVEFTGNILTEDADQVQPIAAKSINAATITLDNATIIGNAKKADSFNEYAYYTFAGNEMNPSAIEVTANTKINVHGIVNVLGSWNATAIGVAPGVKVDISGDNLSAIGNGGYEYFETGTGTKNYWRTDQTAQWNYDRFNNGSAVKDFHLKAKNESPAELEGGVKNTEEWAYINGTLKNKWNGSKGSGIGSVNYNSETGEIYIHDLNSLVAEGYGGAGYGIGGRISPVNDEHDASITMENINSVTARGGYAFNKRILSDHSSDVKNAKYVLEGGAAIGVGSVEGVKQKISIKNVNIDGAYGGGKSAAIGARFWSDAEIYIENSKVNNVYGGASGAGIGGSRFNEGGDVSTKVTIKDSEITAYGGDFAAAIGSGYDSTATHASDPNLPDDMNIFTQDMDTIKILGNSKIVAKGGFNAATIGSGYNDGYVDITIDDTVDLSGVTRADHYTEEWWIDANYVWTDAMAIGFGVADLNRTSKFGVVGYNAVGGEKVDLTDSVKFVEGAKPTDLVFDATTNTLSWTPVKHGNISIDYPGKNDPDAFGYEITVTPESGTPYVVRLNGTNLRFRDGGAYSGNGEPKPSTTVSGKYVYTFAPGELPEGKFSVSVKAYTYLYDVYEDNGAKRISLVDNNGNLNIHYSDASDVLTNQEETVEVVAVDVNAVTSVWNSTTYRGIMATWTAVSGATNYIVTFTDKFGGELTFVCNASTTELSIREYLATQDMTTANFTVVAYK